MSLPYARQFAVWRHRRRVARDLASIPRELLRDVGLVDLNRPEPGPMRTLDHRSPDLRCERW